MHELIWIGFAGAIIWIIIYIMKTSFDLESKGIEVDWGFLIWRTQHGLGIIDRIANAKKRLWKYFGYFSGGLGTIFMAVMFGILAWNAYTLFTAGPPPGTGGSGIRFVIPGVTIPLVAGLIGLATVLIIHEPAHGVVLRRLGMKTKSTGLALFLVIPGAFVEEDEEEFENSASSDRIQVAGAGPFANLIFAVVCLLLVLALISPAQGLYIANTVEDSPAARAGLPAESRLIGIDDVQIEEYDDLRTYLDTANPGQDVVIKTDEGDYTLNLGSEGGDPYIGIELVASYNVSTSALLRPRGIYAVAVHEILRRPVLNQYSYDTPVPWFIIDVLKWIFTLNLLVGLFNLLPLKPLDGGHIIQALSEKATSKSNAKKIANAASIATLIVIAANFIPSFM